MLTCAECGEQIEEGHDHVERADDGAAIGARPLAQLERGRG